MTLPFRRRHHDDEATHDRARSLTSTEMLEPIAADDAAWLARHLEGCGECRAEREAFQADRELFRSLREKTPEPPRDLWARTAAALDEARSSRGRATDAATSRGSRWRGLPLGAAAGALIVFVVVVSSVWPSSISPNQTPGGTLTARESLVPGPTQMAIDAQPVNWLRPGADGSWELIVTDVDAVCPRAEPRCRPPIDEGPSRPVDLASRPSAVTISPLDDQLVVEARGDAGAPDRILIVPVTPSGPRSSHGPTIPPPSLPPTIPPTAPSSDAPPSLTPSVGPTPAPTPTGQLEIASGVTVVGELAYSANGQWLAFSAQPSDGSAGPDLYLWSPGWPAALPVTSDHRTYFSTWHEGRVVASRIVLPDQPDPAAPGASGEPAVATPGPQSSPEASPGATPAPLAAHATSFLLDPLTLAVTDMTQPDVWLPVVDGDGRSVAYWSGTLRSDDGVAWQLGTGQLVVDGWVDAPEPRPDESASAAPTDGAATPDPASSAAPAPPVGPVGAGSPIASGAIAAFRVRFDPDGTRLAVWVGEAASDNVGRLHLVVVDPDTGAIDETQAPLTATLALRRFSIDTGRLAWISPSGQDGQESAVQVLGWSGDDFGEIQTIPARDLYIVQ